MVAWSVEPWPPTSMASAPSVSSRRARVTASAGVVAMEPSWSESGLALTTP
jgi:hypothetical protein